MLTVAILLLAVPSCFAQKRVALLIGNSDYADSPLKNPVKDVDALEKSLIDLGFTVIKKKNLDRREMINAVEKAVYDLKEPADIFILFFAGHGMEIEGQNYLLPLKHNLRSPHEAEYELVPLKRVQQTLEEGKIVRRVLILDSCRNNPLKNSLSRSGGGGLVAPLGKKEGTIIAYSTKEGRTALDGNGENSPYTESLLKMLAQRPENGLEIKEALIGTARDIEGKFGQKPALYVDAFMQDYYLARTEPVIENSLGMKLNLIKSGKFLMGSPSDEQDRKRNERPHIVEISKSFYLGATEVTQAQWFALMGTKPWVEHAGVANKMAKDAPANAAGYISWTAATEFCEKLSKMEKRRYRLPTEAEWEYACRAGSDRAFSFGDESNRLGEFAWYLDFETEDPRDKFAEACGQKKPNQFGLFDMHGNVYEWCSDWHSANYYRESPLKDPPGPQTGVNRVLRGGSFTMPPAFCRSAGRYEGDPDDRFPEYGFRVVLEK